MPPRKTANSNTASSAKSQKNNTTSTQNFAQTSQAMFEPFLQNFQNMFQTSFDNSQQFFQQATSYVQENAQKAGFGANQNYDDINDFVKSNIDSTVESFNTLQKSFEELSNAYINCAKSAFENQVSNGQAILGCKNIQDAVTVQNKNLQENLEQALSDSAKISQMSVDAASKAIQPIQEQIQSNIETAIKNAA